MRSEGDFVLRSELMVLQKKDPSLSSVWEQLVSEAEAAVTRVCYYRKDRVLMRKWSPLDMPANDDWRVISQVVVPSEYRIEVLHLAHEAYGQWLDTWGLIKHTKKSYSIFTGLA